MCENIAREIDPVTLPVVRRQRAGVGRSMILKAPRRVGGAGGGAQADVAVSSLAGAVQAIGKLCHPSWRLAALNYDYCTALHTDAPKNEGATAAVSFGDYRTGGRLQVGGLMLNTRLRPVCFDGRVEHKTEAWGPEGTHRWALIFFCDARRAKWQDCVSVGEHSTDSAWVQYMSPGVQLLAEYPHLRPRREAAAPRTIADVMDAPTVYHERPWQGMAAAARVEVRPSTAELVPKWPTLTGVDRNWIKAAMAAGVPALGLLFDEFWRRSVLMWTGKKLFPEPKFDIRAVARLTQSQLDPILRPGARPVDAPVSDGRPPPVR